MIKTYAELTGAEKQRLWLWLSAIRNPAPFSHEDAMDRLYGGPACTGGKTQWSAWESGSPVASMALITEAAQARHELFITGVFADTPLNGVLDRLLTCAREAALVFEGCGIRMGAAADMEDLCAWADTQCDAESRLLELALVRPSQPPQGLLHWESMNETRGGDWRSVTNLAFLDAPNGGVISPEDMEEMIREHRERPWLLQTGYEGGVPLATLELCIKECAGRKEGWIQGLAVHPEARGKGYGREALRQSVKLLETEGCDRILMTVFDSNPRALGLYLSEGFARIRVVSQWYQLA